ncbi:DUF4124 domain-containing protein [Moritella sp. Urea-trap-13]|uniref:DUF4124 domain-containing protein n=1 Tax=Moritella sp. Urea-trap-13 TaxID=2058327 RepID=UPI000C322EFF|nr:DUF4124 domain-containing protein [Moritella sp. Urea-trap-13]PKH05277.1 DUF4124 domain-containing protein [Moritella sp. Urea-trap-13]
MMLNSKSNYKRLLLALVCGSMSYATLAKVYSWRDADGAMHYSQFPRQIVEKNAAQSRASRTQIDMNDVVKDLSASKKVANLLDGLDDIVANANVERQIDKVLTRRDPQLVLIELQLARQQVEQRALLVAQQHILKQQQTLAAINNAQINRVEAKQAPKPTNKFLVGIQNKLKRQQIATRPQSVSVVEPNNAFLAAIKRKLNRKQVADNLGAGRTPAAALAQSNADINAHSRRTTTVKNKELIQGADQIKAIENEISHSRKSSKAKTPSAKQVNSALMLSRLSYNQKARLSLLGAGINQLDMQDIDVSSQFVNEVNRHAE